MILQVISYFAELSFWGWFGFISGIFISGAILSGFINAPFNLIGILKKDDANKQLKWENDRDNIANAIVKSINATKLDQIKKELDKETKRKRDDFENHVKTHNDNAKSEYFFKLGLYSGLLGFFRSITESSNGDYYQLNILGIPVVSIRSEDVCGGKSVQIKESMFLQHSFLAQYLLPLRTNTQPVPTRKKR